MRFALLGNHPDGIAMARALAATGRHTLVVYSGPRPGLDDCRLFAPELKPIGDLEEVLADPAVEAVIVAGKPVNRTEPLRRALQSERVVLCVHPADDRPDAAYEAGMIQADTKKLLLPLLTDAFHPGIARLVELMRTSAVGAIRLIELEIAAQREVLIDTDVPGREPSLPGWHLLRRLGGEVAEVSAFAQAEELSPDQPILVSGRFQSGGIFQVRLLPNLADQPWQLRILGEQGHASLTLARDGAARLRYEEEVPHPGSAAAITTAGAAEQLPRLRQPREETWDRFDPWPALVEIFEEALHPSPPKPLLTWQDELRCLELDDAARRSLERRRASSMEYQDASEEVGFKGTMTLVGCALLWSILVVLFLSVWFPRLGWVIAPILAIFLGLQLLRWLIPRPPPAWRRTVSGNPVALAGGGTYLRARLIRFGESAMNTPERQPAAVSLTSLSLLERVKAREPAAWQRLVQLYGPLVYQWCRRFDLSVEDAADVAQEVFQSVALHVAEFRRDRPGDSFRGWLWTISRNKIRDHFRHRQQQPSARGGSDAQAHLQQVPEHAPDDDGQPASPTVALVHRALDLLRDEFEERTWQMFWRSAVLGQSPKEIAADLGVTPDAVRMAKSRVLRRLRDELAES